MRNWITATISFFAMTLVFGNEAMSDPLADCKSPSSCNLKCPKGTSLLKDIKKGGYLRGYGCQNSKGQWHGPKVKFKDGGKILQMYRNGKIHGLKVGYNSQNRKISESTYSDGVENGRSTRWYDNGQIREQGMVRAVTVTDTFGRKNKVPRFCGHWKHYTKDGRPSPAEYPGPCKIAPDGKICPPCK